MNIVTFTPADENPPWTAFGKGGKRHASPFIKGGLRGIFTVSEGGILGQPLTHTDRSKAT